MKANELAKLLALPCQGDLQIDIDGLCSLAHPKSSHILFLEKAHFSPDVLQKTDVFLIEKGVLESYPPGKTFIITQTPRLSFIALLGIFNKYKPGTYFSSLLENEKSQKKLW